MSKCAKVLEDNLEIKNLKRAIRKCKWTYPFGHCFHEAYYEKNGVPIDIIDKCCSCPDVGRWKLSQILLHKFEIKPKESE